MKLKNYIQKNRLRWFGHMMQMREERISNKYYTHKSRKDDKRGKSITRWIDQIRKDIHMREKIGKEYKKTISGRIETAGDFSLMVNPYLWKRQWWWWWWLICLYIKLKLLSENKLIICAFENLHYQISRDPCFMRRVWTWTGSWTRIAQ